MIEAKRTSLWKFGYRISVDGHEAAMFTAKWSGTGGWFSCAGQDYEIRMNAWGTGSTLIGPDGAVVATAERLQRKHWSVRTEQAIHRFRRASAWKMDQSLVVDGQRAGSITFPGSRRGKATAELPGLPLPVQVFALFTVLSIMWNSRLVVLMIILMAAGTTAGS